MAANRLARACGLGLALIPIRRVNGGNHMKIVGALALAGALFAAPAWAAEDGPAQEESEKLFFFSNPAAARGQVIADWEECRELASAVRPPQAASVYTPNAVGALAAGFMQGLIQGAQRRHMFDAALRKCMNVKGYQRYAMTKPDFEALYDGKWPELKERLADKALAPVGGATRLDP